MKETSITSFCCALALIILLIPTIFKTDDKKLDIANEYAIYAIQLTNIFSMNSEAPIQDSIVTGDSIKIIYENDDMFDLDFNTKTFRITYKSNNDLDENDLYDILSFLFVEVTPEQEEQAYELLKNNSATVTKENSKSNVVFNKVNNELIIDVNFE